MGDTTRWLRDHPIGNTEFLVDKAKAGSQTAWNEIYKRYRTMLVANVQARISGYARRRFDSEDVLQLAFFRAWQCIQSFEYRGEGSFRRWLATLVVNTFRNEDKRRKDEHGHAGPASDGDDDEP